MADFVYRLEITRLEKNPAFTPGPRGPYDREVAEFLSTNALSILVTEAQFEAIRKAVLEQF